MVNITYNQMNHIIRMEREFFGLYSLMDGAIDSNNYQPIGARIILKELHPIPSEWAVQFLEVHDLFESFKHDPRFRDAVEAFEKRYEAFLELSRDTTLTTSNDTILSFKREVAEVSSAIQTIRKALLRHALGDHT